MAQFGMGVMCSDRHYLINTDMRVDEVTLEYKEVPVSSIKRTEGNISAYAASPKTKKLLTDIESGKGIKYALTVSRVKDQTPKFRKAFPTNKQYYLHDGHHRLTAAQLAGMKTVKVRIIK